MPTGRARASTTSSTFPPTCPFPEIVKAVTYLARDKKIDRIVALDEFDMETASTLREHMRIPGMGLTTMRYFRDKLAMRMQALEHGIRVPDFIPVLNHDDIRYYLDHVPGPWVLKPRSEASAIGIKLIDSPDALWPILDSLGDQQSSFLLEKFIPGDVYHVDSVVSEREVVFSSVSRYGQPPMAVAQKGGIFTTYLLPADSEEATSLRAMNHESDSGAGTGARRIARGVHPRPQRWTFLFSGMRGPGGRRLHQRDGRNRHRHQPVAGVGAHRNRRRQGTLPAPCRARRLCRIDPVARPAGRSGHFGLQRS